MGRKRKNHLQSPNNRIAAYRCLRRRSGNDIAYVDVAGKRHYLGAYDTPESRERYHRLIAEWEASGRAEPTAQHEVTVIEVAAQYLAWARTYYMKHGHLTAEPENIALAIRPLKQLYGSTRACEFGPRALKAVRQKMIEAGWVRKHINKQADRIKRMFKWAVSEELVPSGIYEGLRSVSGLRYGRSAAPDNPPVQPVPDGLIEPVKRFVSKQVAAMIELQLLTGGRPGEIVIIRPGDIDRSGPIWVYRPSEHKTEHHGHERTIFLGPKAQEVLSPFLLRPADAYCFSPAEAERDRRAALTIARITPDSCGNGVGTHRTRKPQVEPGDHYTRNSYRRAIDRAQLLAFPPPEHLQRQQRPDGTRETIKEWQARLTDADKAELKAWYKKHHWHPHQLRHNYATYVRKQFGLEAAQVLLGHSKADVTQIYAERDMQHAATVASKIG